MQLLPRTTIIITTILLLHSTITIQVQALLSILLQHQQVTILPVPMFLLLKTLIIIIIIITINGKRWITVLHPLQQVITTTNMKHPPTFVLLMPDFLHPTFDDSMCIIIIIVHHHHDIPLRLNQSQAVVVSVSLRTVQSTCPAKECEHPLRAVPEPTRK